MYIDKYWGNYIGGSDDSLNLVAFLVDQGKEEIPLNEIFSKIGLDRQNWDFHQTMEYLEFTHSDGVEMDFHFAIDVVTDLAAILLECSVSGSVNLQDLDKYNTPSRRIRITATVEEHNAMDRTLADFAQNPLSYDLHEMMDDEEILEMACDVEALRKELYESAGRNRSFHVKAEDMKNLLPDWDGANGCIATNRITVEGCNVGFCYREKSDGDWDSGWRFTAGDESDEYMDDPNNSGIYGLNTICNDDPDIIPLLHTPAPCAFERNENGVFQQIKDWEPDPADQRLGTRTGGKSMRDLCQYGNRPDDQWEILPWIPEPRPPFEIWVKPEQIAPFFLIPHHPYAISLLLKISDGFRTEEFRRLGRTGSCEDWERLVRGVIREFEENNSGKDLFHFDSDDDVFCVYSQYIDDLMMLAKMIRAACDDEKTMEMYLNN